MTALTSTAYSRDLGDELRSLREQSGQTGAAFADRLGWDASKVSPTAPRSSRGWPSAPSTRTRTALAPCSAATSATSDLERER
ncbi:helix-turn-helix domain-containing protein [Lentzea guizhouensis]|uniref:helix-turn-helix domain-containing protein n=1 Tax=Lentzea guizhouensis TaxID=1586287 RepID=UPI0012B69F3A|nr:helix-turn-helix transcriptional regulator [Lentzea guizhouensis]